MFRLGETKTLYAYFTLEQKQKHHITSTKVKTVKMYKVFYEHKSLESFKNIAILDNKNTYLDSIFSVYKFLTILFFMCVFFGQRDVLDINVSK